MSEPAVCVLGLACCGLEAAAAMAGPQEPGADDVAAQGADGGSVLVVAGTVTTKLAARLRSTYEDLPGPVAVIAYGACAISGGPYWDSYSVLPGADQVVPVTTCVAGCPPRPADLRAALASLPGGHPQGQRQVDAGSQS
jgi:NADH-quinone oxidoreductase subunit B